MTRRLWALALLIAALSCTTPGGKAKRPVTRTAPMMASHEDAERWATSTLRRLSLERKVAQMICEQMRGGYVSDDHHDYRYWSSLVRDYGIGGFVVYGGTPLDTAHLLNRLQTVADIPLLISSDFEGGPGQQFVGASEFPANMALAAIGSEELAYEVGKVGALEGRAIGIHLTYSPVVDIQTRPENPVLSVRSFGSDVDLLGRLAGAYIRGYQENGMLATAKHFPGRGDVDLIPATEYTIINKPADQVEREDLAAFKKAIDAGVAFVMSEHIAVPSVAEGSDLPASVEARLAGHWLRERLGFQGVLTSDDLWYPKVVERFGAERVGVMAIQAGHDALLKPADAIAMMAAVVDAVRSGQVTEERIDASVKKILYWKARLNLHRDRFVDPERVSSVVGIQEHRDLVGRVAERSLTLLANNGFFPTKGRDLGRIVHVLIQKDEHHPVALEASKKLEAAFSIEKTFLLRPSVDPALYQETIREAEQADTVIVSLFHQRTVYKDNGRLRPQDLSFVQSLIEAKPRSTVILSYGNPYLVEGVENAAAFVVGYGEGGFFGNQLVYADAFIRLVKGEIAAEGKLPVRTGVD